ncbi:MAG TPA: hypothetical protein PK275_13025 [Chitinophagaceae bacterium]|jgi:hypothetical protein|nr:hypothetical protein [Chitinophagaceae bacterium]
MIKVGQWIGQYKFDKETHQKITGFDSTNFVIEIINVDSNCFRGNVHDDLTTGGTEGIGGIQGEVTGDIVKFVKQMPVMTLILGKNKTKKTLNRKHRKIYYSGKFSDDKKSISGHWRFKFGFIWFGLIPIPVAPTRGTWTMKLKE